MSLRIWRFSIVLLIPTSEKMILSGSVAGMVGLYEGQPPKLGGTKAGEGTTIMLS